jgi:hypothetical protein
VKTAKAAEVSSGRGNACRHAFFEKGKGMDTEQVGRGVPSMALVTGMNECDFTTEDIVPVAGTKNATTALNANRALGEKGRTTPSFIDQGISGASQQIHVFPGGYIQKCRRTQQVFSGEIDGEVSAPPGGRGSISLPFKCDGETCRLEPDNAHPGSRPHVRTAVR